MKLFLKKFETLEEWFNSLSALILVGMMLMVAANVLLRYTANHPILGTLEFTEFMMVAAVYLALSHTQRVKGHIDIELITSQLSGRKRQWCELLTCLCGLIFFALVAWQGVMMTLEAYVIQEVTFGTIEIQEWPFKLFVPLGSIVISIRFLIEVTANVGRLIKGEQ